MLSLVVAKTEIRFVSFEFVCSVSEHASRIFAPSSLSRSLQRVDRSKRYFVTVQCLLGRWRNDDEACQNFQTSQIDTAYTSCMLFVPLYWLVIIQILQGVCVIHVLHFMGAWDFTRNEFWWRVLWPNFPPEIVTEGKDVISERLNCFGSNWQLKNCSSLSYSRQSIMRNIHEIEIASARTDHQSKSVRTNGSKTDKFIRDY